jgi:hypothetical protein
MNKAVKGAVLSGLVLPGLGQMVLKHHIRGALLMLASLACVALLVAQAVAEATAIFDKVDLVNGAIDPVALLNSLNQAGADSSGSLVGMASLLLVFLWLGGTVDAYLLGRKEDLRECRDRPLR